MLLLFQKTLEFNLKLPPNFDGQALSDFKLNPGAFLFQPAVEIIFKLPIQLDFELLVDLDPQGAL